MSSQVAQDLRSAAEVLRRDGWMQGYMGIGDSPKCAVGGLCCAIGGRPSAVFGSDALFDRYEAAWEALQREIGTPPVVFNDAPGRTADEVIAALEAAADAAEAQS